MTAKKRERQQKKPSAVATAAAAEMVKFYDGDQVNRPCVEVVGHFLLPVSDLSSCAVAKIRRSMALRLDALLRTTTP